MSASSRLPEGPPVIPPRQSFESYIALRQCFDGQGDYLSVLNENQEHDFRVDLESAISSGDLDRQASLLRAPLSKAVSAGAAMLKLSGEQSLAGTADFNNKLQSLLRGEYEIAANAVWRDESNSIPGFPFQEKRLIRTLLRGPNGKRAVEQVRQYILPESDS